MSAIHRRIGELTRELHDALRALGHDRALDAAARSLPDARDRLAYVATLTGQAAERVLAAVEAAGAEQDRLASAAAALRARHDALPADDPGLARAIREHLDDVVSATAATRARLHDIMMAQDFHDRSGQVLQRVTEVARSVEASLVALLVDTLPADTPAAAEALAGPVIRPGTDSVASQQEVDDLLASLGF